MTSCGRLNIRTYREIKNAEQYIVLDISSNIDWIDKREVTSSESRGYMVRPGKGMTTSLGIGIKILNKKQRKSFPITDITH